MSSQSESERRGLKLLTPIVYALIFPVTVYLAYTVTYYALPASPDSGILLYGVPLIVFCCVYGVCGWLLLLIEHLPRPGFLDHLRRTCLLYLGALIGIGSMVAFPYIGVVDKGYVIFPIGGLFCAFAIVIDAVILVVVRVRLFLSSRRTNARSSA